MDPRQEKLRQLRLEAERLAEAPGCDSCLHNRNFLCTHPLIQEMSPDVYRGGVKFVGAKSVEVMRAPEGQCGPMGDLYTSLSPQERAGRWLGKGATALVQKITAPVDAVDLTLLGIAAVCFATRRGVIFIPAILIGWIIWRVFFREK